MHVSWQDSRRAFTDAAEWLVRTTRLVGARWDQPALGEWDVRALVGHTSRSFLTVETYLDRPAATVELATTADYFRATRAIAAGPAAVAEIAARVLRLLDSRDGTELVTTIAGGMRLRDYLPTRTFELAVHTADLASAIGEPLDVPLTAATQALMVVNDLALADGLAGQLLLAATGRPRPPSGFSVL
jgi:hypothetical protein